jgi:tungstate transport system substrate-binding protein
VEGRRHRRRQGERFLVPRDRPGHGLRAAYTISDRGTWISFKNKGDLAIVVEGDKRLFNQYGVMLVNPQRHPNVKKELGQQFIDWLISAEGQKVIADYRIDGQQLFYPNADEPGA